MRKKPPKNTSKNNIFDRPPGGERADPRGVGQGEIPRIVLQRARFLALLHQVGALAGQPPVLRIARDAEVDVAFDGVREALLEQLLDEAHDPRNVLRRPRQPVRHAEPEVARVLEVPLRRTRGELRARTRRSVVDLVVDVGDVVDERRVIRAMPQPVAQPHAEYERPCVADVRPLVDRRPAEVHADGTGPGRRQIDQPPLERAVEAHVPSVMSAGAARPAAAPRSQLAARARARAR